MTPLKCETLGAILHYSLLASFTGPNASFVELASMHSLLTSFSCSFSRFAWLFSWLNTHVHKIYTLSALVVQQLDIVDIPCSEA